MSNRSQLPEDVLEALSRGQTIEALKRLRAATGLGLREAKDLLDRHLQQPVGGFTEERAANTAVPPSVRDALAAGKKIEAIRLYREHFRTGLKEAKDAVDELERRAGPVTPLSHPQLAPGEVPAPNRWLWLVIALVAACAVVYYVLIR